MKTPRIITTFTKYSDANLEAKAESIVSAMTDNPYFLTPMPTLADVSDMIANYSEALAEALDGGRTQVAMKNEARMQLEDTLRQLGAYVTLTAQTDRTILITSGFELAKEAEPRPPITTPQNLVAASGFNSGEIELKVDAVKGAKTYSHEYTPDPLTENSSWAQEPDTRRKHLFTDMEPGKKYWFRVAAIGTKQQRVYSSEIACIVQ